MPVNAHRTLDEDVFAAYGWPSNLSKDEILARLLALNHERAEAQAATCFGRINALDMARWGQPERPP